MNVSTGATGATGVIATNVLSAINSAEQTPAAANEALVFNTNRAIVGTGIQHTAGTVDFVLNETGTYDRNCCTIGQKTYDTTTSDAAGTTPPIIATLSLEQDGVKIQGSSSSATIATANQAATLASNAIVTVATAPSTITLVAGNTSADYAELNMTIIKLD